MKLTIILASYADLLGAGGSIKHKSVQIELTEEQVKQIGPVGPTNKFRWNIEQCFIEPGEVTDGQG